MPEEEFEELIADAKPGFEIADWFPSQGKNFTRVDEGVFSHFGGDEGFIDALREWEIGRRKPGTENYFLLNSTQTPADVENEHIFSFEQKSPDLADEILAAENDG